MKKLFIIIKISLFAAVSLYASNTNFDAIEQSSIIASALKQYYGISGNFELTSVTPLMPVAGKPTSVELLEMPSAPVSIMPIKVRYMKDGQSIGEISSTFKVQWRVNVLVAKRPLNKGPLDPSDFEVQTVDRFSLRQTPVEAQNDLKGYEIANSMAAGIPLTWNYLKSQPLVHKGTLVDVIALEGNLRISTRAVALADAGRGESVTMRNLTTNRPFEAFVVNENLVQIRF